MGLELDFLFHPRSIAVAGASSDPQKRGHAYVDALLHHGFPGPVYPINPKGEEVLGLRGYTSVAEVPEPVDYVISSVPASAVLDLVDDCAKKSVRSLHLFTARFSETGHADAAELEQEILRRAQRAGIRLLGPNCMGVYHPAKGMSYMRFSKEPGSVGVLSQSGGNLNELLYVMSMRGVRFSKAVSYGNAIDINEADLLEYLAADPETSVIGGYIEGVKTGPRFMQALRDAAARKPLVLQKGGISNAGTRAVASHTASLAGSRQVWETALQQSNVVAVENLEDLGDMLLAFQFCKPASGHRVGIYGGGGGRSVESADSCENAGLTVEPIPEELRREFRQRGSELADWVSNPIDGSILPGTGLDQETILRLMAKSPNYDMFIVSASELWNADNPKSLARLMRSPHAFLDMAGELDKPMALVMNDTVAEHQWQNEFLAEMRRKAVEKGVPIFPSIRRAAKAMSRMATYYKNRETE